MIIYRHKASVETAGGTGSTNTLDVQGGANGFKETIGGGSGRDDELVLKQNETYLRTFTSFADDNIVQFKASWYEHTDKQ